MTEEHKEGITLLEFGSSGVVIRHCGTTAGTDKQCSKGPRSRHTHTRNFDI